MEEEEGEGSGADVITLEGEGAAEEGRGDSAPGPAAEKWSGESPAASGAGRQPTPNDAQTQGVWAGANGASWDPAAPAQPHADIQAPEPPRSGENSADGSHPGTALSGERSAVGDEAPAHPAHDAALLLPWLRGTGNGSPLSPATPGSSRGGGGDAGMPPPEPVGADAQLAPSLTSLLRESTLGAPQSRPASRAGMARPRSASPLHPPGAPRFYHRSDEGFGGRDEEFNPGGSALGLAPCGPSRAAHDPAPTMGLRAEGEGSCSPLPNSDILLTMENSGPGGT